MALSKILLGLLIGTSLGICEDEKAKDKIFISQSNEIKTIHIGQIGTTKYTVIRWKRKLDIKNSKGKGVTEKSNYGDSASTYCYKKETDISDIEKQILIEAFKNGKPVTFSYSCGELAEEDKRKVFLGFAETNCQCLDFTFEWGGNSWRY
jgi:hypothetical protein